MRIKIVIPLLLTGLAVIFLPFVFPSKYSGATGDSTSPATSDFKTSASASNIGVPGAVAVSRNARPDQPAAPLIKSPSEPDGRHDSGTGISTASESPVSSGDKNEGPMAGENQDYTEQRIDELTDLGMAGDTNSLVTIESEFDNRDPRIQEAAISAAIQFGSRDAIPALQDAFNHTDDPAQKLRIQKAIEYLELPTQSETATATPNGGVWTR